MKGVVYRGPRDVRVEDVPDAKIDWPTDVLVRITSTNICGSDLHMYEGRTDLEPGMVIGHENLGQVIEVGGAVKRIKKGDWVCMPFNVACGYCRNCERGYTGFCLSMNSDPKTAGAAYGYAGMGPYRGGQAELLTVPYGDFNCLRLHDDAEEKETDYVMLADIWPTGWHATELAGLKPGETVVVYGCGPVGLMAAYSAIVKGAAQVYIVDRHPDRLKLAESIGAIPIDDSKDDPVEAVMELTHGLGADRGCECVGWQAHDPQGHEHPNMTAANGRWIAYSDFTETSNVWTLPIPADPPASVRQAEPVTSGNQVTESLDLSRDGRWLAFDSDRSGNQDIYRQPLSGGEPERLTDSDADEFWPAWSPSGAELAFHGFKEGRRHLFLMSADGRDRRQLTAGPDDERTPAWAPDGRTLYYLHNFNGPGNEIRAITRAPDGRWSAARTLFRGITYPPAPSPDGRLLAFTSAGAVWVVGTAGDSARVLVRSGDRAADPRAAYVSWSDDSRALYYLAVAPTGETSIWSVAVTGGPPRLMVRFDDPSREWHRFGFVARGGRFYFTVGDRQSDVWAAEVEAGM